MKRDTVIAWLIIFAAFVWMAGCSHGCPKPPPCVPPPPVVVVKSPPPCTLPPLPEPLPPGFGVPDAVRDGYFVPRQSWALLGGYVAGLREWVVAANGCLVAGRHAP